MAEPKSKAQMDPNFEKRLRDCKEAAAEEAAQRVSGGQSRWFRPTGWNGNPFDFAGLGVPFDRTVSTQGYLEAVKDAENPGTGGDVVATITMIEALSVMERAMRVRHTLRRTRATAHMLARKQLHGTDTGAFIQTGVEYVRSVLKQAKEG